MKEELNQIVLDKNRKLIFQNNVSKTIVEGKKEYEIISRPYTIYTALLSQTDIYAPTAIELENTLGATISFTRSSAGVYNLLADQPVFLEDKTFYQITMNNTLITTQILLSIYRIGDNTFKIEVGDSIGGWYDDILNNTPFEIRVYN